MTRQPAQGLQSLLHWCRIWSTRQWQLMQVRAHPLNINLVAVARTMTYRPRNLHRHGWAEAACLRRPSTAVLATWNITSFHATWASFGFIPSPWQLSLSCSAHVLPAEGRLLRVRELLRQAAARHGCSFSELLADGADAAFGTAATCSLDLQQVRLPRSMQPARVPLIQELLADCTDTVFGPTATCSLNLQQGCHCKDIAQSSSRTSVGYMHPGMCSLFLHRVFHNSACFAIFVADV